MKIILKYKEQIQLLNNLKPILNLSNFFLNKFNFKISRLESRQILIKNIINTNSNNNINELIKKFIQSWNKISYGCLQYKCKILDKLKEINIEMPINYLLVDDKENGGGLYLAAAFQFFADIQNEIINELNNYNININNDKNVINEQIPIQFVSDEDIINIDDEILNNFENFYYIFDNKYNINFNFSLIENDIKKFILKNYKIKKLNSENLNTIQFKNEILSINNQHTNFITIITKEIKQEKINENIFDSLIKFFNKNSNQMIINIFNEIELLCCQLKYEINIKNSMTIENYINTKINKNNFSLILNENLIKNLLLNNIIELYEIFENKIFDLTIENISPDYKIKIENKNEIKKQFEIIFNKENINFYPNRIQVLNVLKKFIFRCLNSDIENQIDIKEYLNKEDFWNKIGMNNEEIEELEMKIDNLYNNFPNNLKIKNAYELFKILNDMNT